LLVCLSRHPAGLRYKDFVRELGLPNITITRLLHALMSLGYVSKSGDGVYLPGAGLRALGAARESLEDSLRRICVEPMRQLAGQCANSAALLMWTGGHAVFLDRELHEGSLVFMPRDYVIQAPLNTPWAVFFLSEARWERALEEQIKEPESRERTRQWLAGERRRLIEHGYCAGHSRGRRRIAAPVRDAQGRAVAALAVGGTPDSLSDEAILRHGPFLADLARACGERLALMGSFDLKNQVEKGVLD
jgi:DNA-binding IclR family transcriptional regulator